VQKEKSHLYKSTIYDSYVYFNDRLCGLAFSFIGYRSGSIPGITKKKSSESGTGCTQPPEYNWGATWQKSSGSCLENQEYGRRDPSRWPRGTLYPQKLAIPSPTSGGRSVGVVRSRTQNMNFFVFFFTTIQNADMGGIYASCY
jgi:hypothetical protein